MIFIDIPPNCIQHKFFIHFICLSVVKPSEFLILFDIPEMPLCLYGTGFLLFRTRSWPLHIERPVHCCASDIRGLTVFLLPAYCIHHRHFLDLLRRPHNRQTYGTKHNEHNHQKLPSRNAPFISPSGSHKVLEQNPIKRQPDHTS